MKQCGKDAEFALWNKRKNAKEGEMPVEVSWSCRRHLGAMANDIVEAKGSVEVVALTDEEAPCTKELD